MKITNSISTCIIFFPFIIASAMEENNIKKNESNYQEKKICFEIKVSSNAKEEDILNNTFWTDKIGTENHLHTLDVLTRSVRLYKLECDISLEAARLSYNTMAGKLSKEQQ